MLPSRHGLFHSLAASPLWSEAREEEAIAAHHLVQCGRPASELVGTRAQVLACLCVQDAWRQRQRQRGRSLTAESVEEWDGYEVVEVEVVLSSDASTEQPPASESSAPPDVATATEQPPASASEPSTTAPPAVAPSHPTSQSVQPAAMSPSKAAVPTDSARKEVIVKRELADVFDVVSDFEAYPQWVSGLQKVQVLERDASSGLGRVVQFTAGAMGLSMSYTLRYEWSAPESLSWVSIAGGVKSIVGQYQLSPASGGGTRVQYRLEVDTGFKMPAMVRRTATNLVIGAALPELKRQLERGRTGAQGRQARRG